MDQATYDKGLEIRRSVLGKEFVDAAIANATDFNKPLQDYVTEMCWGAIWGRPGLDKKQRSMINLAMIATLNRQHELKLHVKGAIKNGLTKDDIREVLLQVACYAGIPCGVDSFRTAMDAFKEMGI